MMSRLVQILDPEGQLITVPLWVVVRLQQRKFLYRDKATGRKRIKAEIDNSAIVATVGRWRWWGDKDKPYRALATQPKVPRNHE